MDKIYETIEIMQKLCDINLSIDDLKDLNTDMDVKKIL